MNIDMDQNKKIRLTIGPFGELLCKLYAFSISGFIILFFITMIASSIFFPDKVAHFDFNDITGWILLVSALLIFAYFSVSGFSYIFNAGTIYANSIGIYANIKELPYKKIKSFQISTGYWVVIQINYVEDGKLRKILGTIGFYCGERKIDRVRNILLSHGIDDVSIRGISVFEKIKNKLT